MKAHYLEYNLHFARQAKTSRGILKKRPVWYLFLEEGGITGVGECAPLSGLSKETPQQVRSLLAEIVGNPADFLPGGAKEKHIKKIPSLRFALETAQKDLEMGGGRILFPSDFTDKGGGIPINGLIWMGDILFMKEQIEKKLKQGFRCIKLKIGSLQFDQELHILQKIREKYSPEEITLRVDANGAFSREDPSQRLKLLERLAEVGIHSIEQPVMAGQWREMAELCRISPLAIALDEELIGVDEPQEKAALLDTIAPHYLVLKPSLHGGWSGCDEWIALAEERGIGWWITSYLESNIGLNAIAQWTYTKYSQYPKLSKLHQGLGTGGLFTNNINSPLFVHGERLFYDAAQSFPLPSLLLP